MEMLATDRVISTQSLSHLLEFDAERGLIRCEAGITLDSHFFYCPTRLFSYPVTPGTKFPTLGGCVAADVHGKNHHKDGSIGFFCRRD